MARNKEFSEKDVLEKAINLFSEKGFNGISMQELVDGLAINRSSIYDTFGDKEQLFLQALQHYRKAYTQKMLDMIENSTDIKKTIQDIFEFIIEDIHQDKKKLGCFMVNTSVDLASHEKKISNIVHENMLAIEEMLTKAIKKAQAQKQINQQLEPQTLARFVSNNINGLRLAGRLKLQDDWYMDIIKATLKIF